MPSTSITPSAPQTDQQRTIARITGWILVLLFFSLSTTDGKFQIVFHGPFTYLSAGELKFWLASIVLLFPGTLLIGYGYQEKLGEWITRVSTKLNTLSPRECRVALLAITLLAITAARLMNAVILYGYPITDDEYATKFGGETLAYGKVFVTPPFPVKAVPYLFLFLKGESLAGMDWTGAQLAWTIATVTRSGNWIFAILAAIPLGCLAYVAGKRLNKTWAGVAALIFFMSPMAWALSMTTHGHLLSRAFLALALAVYIGVEKKSDQRRWLFFGLFLGIAFICRPFETTFIAFPGLCVVLFQLVKKAEKGHRAAIVAILVGGIIPIIGFTVHSWLVTGGLIPPRHASGSTGVPVMESSYLIRFGSNCCFNFFLLAIWFGGPLGIILIIAGALTDGFTKTLGIGIISVLLLGLLHDNYGIHIVGPIHYSECVIPLTVIAVHGMANIIRGIRGLGLDPLMPASMAVVALVLGLGIFNGIHGIAMHNQAGIQKYIYESIDASVSGSGQKTVLLAPRFFDIRHKSQEFNETGSWVFEWRRPKPDFSDDILILHDIPNAEGSIRQAFPDRRILRMRAIPDEPFFLLSPVEPK
jgi:hypothetical protein